MPPKATLSCTVLTTDAEWAAALKPDAEKGCLAVVECYAGWCGPSEAASGTLTRMSVEMVGRRIKFYQVRPLPLMRCLPTGMTALADPAIVCRVRRPTRPRSLTCRSGAARDRRRSATRLFSLSPG